MTDKDVEKRIIQLEEHLRENPTEVDLAPISDHSFYSSLNGETINVFTNKIRLQKAAEYLKYSSR